MVSHQTEMLLVLVVLPSPPPTHTIGCCDGIVALTMIIPNSAAAHWCEHQCHQSPSLQK